MTTSSKRERDICKKALAKWGEDAQTRQAIEECAELMLALLNSYRNRNTPEENVMAITEEIADVELMCRQLRVMTSDVLVDLWKEKKLKRLEAMLEEPEETNTTKET